MWRKFINFVNFVFSPWFLSFASFASFAISFLFFFYESMILWGSYHITISSFSSLHSPISSLPSSFPANCSFLMYISLPLPFSRLHNLLLLCPPHNPHTLHTPHTSHTRPRITWSSSKYIGVKSPHTPCPFAPSPHPTIGPLIPPPRSSLRPAHPSAPLIPPSLQPKNQ